MYNKVLKVLNDYGDKLVSTYKNKLPVATGNLKNSISFKVLGSDGDYEIELKLLDYWTYLENGRQEGSFPPIESIKDCIRVKNIIPEPYILPNGEFKIPTEEQLTFLISRSIAENGIKAGNYLKSSEEELRNELINNLKLAFSEDIEEIIINEFK